VYDHLRALRPHQWTKNGFVFAALVFSRQFTDFDASLRALTTFVAFCAIASAVYLFNDVSDYDRDKVHPSKRNRPIAADLVSKRNALLMAAVLGSLGVGIGWTLGPSTLTVLALYLGCNLLYSIALKHIVLVDVFMIALGFLFRVTAGAFAIEVGVSAWLLVCTLFVALFMAFCKRRAEITTLGDSAVEHRDILMHYSLPFIDKVTAALAGMTIMSYALYAIDPAVIRRLGTDALFLTVPLVAFGVFRYLFLVHQRGEGGSPTRLVLTDNGLRLVVLAWLLISIGAIFYGVQLGLLYAEPLVIPR
jgi:4-hydroxybenzoate polyprenyltransferase